MGFAVRINRYVHVYVYVLGGFQCIFAVHIDAYMCMYRYMNMNMYMFTRVSVLFFVTIQA